MSTGHHPDLRPRFDPTLSWSTVLTLVTLIAGGATTLWVISANYSKAEARMDQVEKVITLRVDEVERKAVSAREEARAIERRVDSRLNLIHNDVQAIKDILISGTSNRRNNTTNQDH